MEVEKRIQTLFQGASVASICSTADPELAKELLVNSPIESPDTPTCW